MPLPVNAGVPLLVAMLFSVALHVVARRRPQIGYAALWSGAFAAIAAGWLVNFVGLVLAQGSFLPGAASRLCWLASSLLFVQGLRMRAGRRNRAVVLQAIWAAVALAEALVADFASFAPAMAASCAPLLTGIGSVLAAVAIRSPFRQARAIDWLAAMVLMGAAIGNVLLAQPSGGDPASAMLPIGAGLAYVAIGAVVLVLLSEDLAIALEKLARTDPLTKLWNRRAFDEAAPNLLARAHQRSVPLAAAVAITDIDAFKSINDRFGHTIGDDVLIWFARQLERALGPRDMLARLGGEEFVFLAIGVSGADLLDRLESLRASIAGAGDLDARLPRITASFGVADYRPALGLRDALERADRALYHAKESGRDRTVLDGDAGA